MKHWTGIIAVGVVVIVAAVLLVTRSASNLPSGPVDVVWDRAVCGHCGMRIRDPHFAVQLQTKRGAIVNFDDTGCFFRYVAARHPETHAVYFHHAHAERWIALQSVSFEKAAQTPKGFNLAAVEHGPISLVQAREHCLQRQQ